MPDPTNRREWLGILPKASVGAEVGVGRGRFSKFILRIVQPSLLWLVDCWEAQPDVRWNSWDWEHVHNLRNVMHDARKRCADGRVRVLCGYSAEMSKYVPDGSLDWVYIDAGHLYAEVRDDLSFWFPKVKAGGLVAGHDYVGGDAWIAVIGAVGDFMQEHRQTGLKTTKEQLPSFWWVKT